MLFDVRCSASPFLLPSRSQTFRFEEVQMLRFEVFDVEGSFTTSDASKLDVSNQVRYIAVGFDFLCFCTVRRDSASVK